MIRTSIFFNAGISALLGSGLVQAQIDGDVFKFCKQGDCTDCPVALTTAGTGFPECVIYNSADVFTGLDFQTSEGGGFRPYLDIGQPDNTCRILVRTPANTDEPNCGALRASFSHPVCAVLDLEKTFMVQFCCGHDDCQAAGAGKVRRDGTIEPFAPSDFPALYPYAKRSSGGAVMLKYTNGTIIQPFKVGPAGGAGLKRSPPSRITRSSKALQKRGCDKGWTPVAGREDYTKPADNTQVVARSVTGPAEIDISQSREQSFTTSMNLGFADILSFGIGFEMTESVTDTTTHHFSVAAGQSGNVGFTAILRCTEGTGHCDGEEYSGEVCTPTYVNTDEGKKIDGLYQLIINS